jgi:hypothetical protein
MFDYSTQAIINTIRELYPFSEEFLICENFNEPLTGRKFRFSKVELTYLFFELEKKLGVTFKDIVLNEYGFSTINKISKVIDQKEKNQSTWSRDE